jgi:NADPH:quinone reductase-like Zn-dependent oxidoreductase
VSRAKAEVKVRRLFTADLAKIVTLCAKGILKPHIDQDFLLSQASRAHELMESRDVKGKLVLSID